MNLGTAPILVPETPDRPKTASIRRPQAHAVVAELWLIHAGTTPPLAIRAYTKAGRASR
jgi:hypothetical protein